MFWSDWGKSCGIYKADMDGLNYVTFIGDKIEWPNGLAIDYPNDRLYWTDAKHMTLESIHLDGTDRRVRMSTTTSLSNYSRLANFIQ